MYGLTDCHLHSYYSFDSSQDIEGYADAAKKQGAKYIAITDHVDLKNNEDKPPQNWQMFFQEVEKIRSEYKNLSIAAGVEIGYKPNNVQANKALIESFPFDYVINSIHDVDNKDCFYPSYYDGTDKHGGWVEYLEVLLESIDAPYYYSAIGHFGYISRNTPFADPSAPTSVYDLIDECFKRIIDKGVILELNTSTYKSGTICLPDPILLKRYYDLGGRAINFASDSHSINRIFDKYSLVRDMASSIGFDGFTIVMGRNYEKIAF